MDNYETHIAKQNDQLKRHEAKLKEALTIALTFIRSFESTRVEKYDIQRIKKQIDEKLGYEFMS